MRNRTREQRRRDRALRAVCWIVGVLLSGALVLLLLSSASDPDPASTQGANLVYEELMMP